MSKNLSDAPHGMNLVIETNNGTVYIGRFDDSNGFEALLHDVDVYDPPEGTDPEAYIRETATYGVDVKHRDLKVDATQVTRWRPLGDIITVPPVRGVTSFASIPENTASMVSRSLVPTTSSLVGRKKLC